MHNVRWNTFPVFYEAIKKKWKFEVICTCLLRSYLKISMASVRVFADTLKSRNIWGSMSQCPKIILYIYTKQINFPRNSSKGHFRQGPSLSWYSSFAPQMIPVACLLMCFTKYGFQTWQTYSKIWHTKGRFYMLSILIPLNYLVQRFAVSNPEPY